jgi:hypothetical protein
MTVVLAYERRFRASERANGEAHPVCTIKRSVTPWTAETTASTLLPAATYRCNS